MPWSVTGRMWRVSSLCNKGGKGRAFVLLTPTETASSLGVGGVGMQVPRPCGPSLAQLSLLKSVGVLGQAYAGLGLKSQPAACLLLFDSGPHRLLLSLGWQGSEPGAAASNQGWKHSYRGGGAWPAPPSHRGKVLSVQLHHSGASLLSRKALKVTA